MNTISYYLGISKQTEVLLLVLAGICCTIFDASLFNLHTNLYKVWNMPMDPTKFTDTAQLYVKYILSSIVLVRTFTVHLYLAFYIVMLWPAIFEEKPGLLIPWLTVGAVKCLATGAMSFSTGMYICLTYRFSKAACWDFMMTQMIDQGPSIYMWFCVLSYYYDLKRDALNILCDRQTPSAAFGLAERRRRVRSLIPSTKLYHTFDDERYLISASTIDTLVNQLNTNLHKQTSRSLDSLLSKIAAEAEKEVIFGTKEEPLEDEKGLSLADKTLRTLNISPSYVMDLKRSRLGLEGKTLKVESTPLPVTRSPEEAKFKTLDIKAMPANSDELSLILSERELHSMDITESPQKLLSTPRSSFRGSDLAIEVQKLFEKKRDLGNVDDNISEYSKMLYFETENFDNHLDKSVSEEENITENLVSQPTERSAVEFLVRKTSCKANCKKIESNLAKNTSQETENAKTDQSIEKPVAHKTSCKANCMKKGYGSAKNILKENENKKRDQLIERRAVKSSIQKPSCRASCKKIENTLAKNISKENRNTKTDKTIEKPAVECLAQKTVCKPNSMKIDNLAKSISKENENVSSTCKTGAYVKEPLPKLDKCSTQKMPENPKIGIIEAKISDHYLEMKNAEDTNSANKYIEKPIDEYLTQKEIPGFSKPTIETVNTTNENILECKCEANDKMVSISKASMHVTQPPPATLKSKSQDVNKSYLAPSAFKYDGYTLAYIESQKRRAAVEIIKNRKRSSSGGR